MRPWCTLCFREFELKIWESASPVVPPCGWRFHFHGLVATQSPGPSTGHVLCYDCLGLADKRPCYFRCGQVTSAEEVRPIRMKFIDCSDAGWCVSCGWSRALSQAFPRQELLSSKAKKRLQEVNANLEKLGTDLDKEREKLAQSLGGFALGGSFETTLHSLTGNLAGLAEASIEFYPQILAYSKRLESLEAEVCRSPLARATAQLIRSDRLKIQRKPRNRIRSERRTSRLLKVRSSLKTYSTTCCISKVGFRRPNHCFCPDGHTFSIEQEQWNARRD
jgi:hypothetical protein